MGFSRRGKKARYDVFISYRRLGGDQTAMLIRENLLRRGYSVFFDVDTLRAGDFNTELLRVIDECTDFIIVLPPNALDRCVNEGDFLRIELEQALKRDKNIIPILLNGFEFPDDMPESIQGLRRRNGLKPVNDYFDAYIAKLCEFLKSKPKRRPKALPWLAAAAIVVALGIAAALYSGHLAGGGLFAAVAGDRAALQLYEEKLKKYDGDEAKAEYAVAYDYYQDQARGWDTALMYAQRSADKGDARAMLLAGMIHYKREEYQVAFDWFTKGARKGNARAFYMLGNMYYYGYYVVKDADQALSFYKKAAGLGLEEAAEVVRKLENR
jgi:hypothetical protein